MFAAFKKVAGNTAINMLLSSPAVLGLVNSKVERYAAVESLRKTEEGFEVLAQLRGASEIIKVTIGDISIKDDGSGVVLKKFSSNVEWVQNLLEDFAEGHMIAIPEKLQSTVLMIKKAL